MTRVPPADLETAILVWLRRCPKSIWKGFEEYETLKAEKRHDPTSAPDPKKALAAYMVACFLRADWAVEMPERGNMFGDR